MHWGKERDMKNGTSGGMLRAILVAGCATGVALAGAECWRLACDCSITGCADDSLWEYCENGWEQGESGWTVTEWEVILTECFGVPGGSHASGECGLNVPGWREIRCAGGLCCYVESGSEINPIPNGYKLQPAAISGVCP